MFDWWRAYHDMTTDPKLRVIARKAGCRVADVLAIWVCILERASQAGQRGTLESWDSEDIACALDMDEDMVDAILKAMQGKLLNGNKVLNWTKRQPKREDENSTNRVREFRERQKQAENVTCETNETQCNATKRNETLDKIREDKRREDLKEKREGEAPPPEAAGPSLEDFPAEVVSFVRGFQAKAKATGGKTAPEVTERLLLKCCQEVERIIRLDGFTLEQLKEALFWALDDNFWSANVRSLAALRKQGKNGLKKIQTIMSQYEKSKGARASPGSQKLLSAEDMMKIISN